MTIVDPFSMTINEEFIIANDRDHRTVTDRESSPEQLLDMAKRKVAEWLIETIELVLTIIGISVIVIGLAISYVVFLKAGDFVLAQTEASLSKISDELPVVAQIVVQLLSGAKIFSILAVAILYVLHVTLLLWLQVQHMVKTASRAQQRGHNNENEMESRPSS